MKTYRSWIYDNYFFFERSMDSVINDVCRLSVKNVLQNCTNFLGFTPDCSKSGRFIRSLFYTFWFLVGQLSSHSSLKGNRIAQNWVKDCCKCEIEWKKSFVCLFDEAVNCGRDCVQNRRTVEARYRLIFFKKAIMPS